MAAAATIWLDFAPMAQAAPIDDPMFTFTFVDLSGDAGSGSLDATLVGAGEYHATSGSLTLTGSHFAGSYSLVPGGPGVSNVGAALSYDNDIYPLATAELDLNGLLFGNADHLINLYELGGQLNFSIYQNDGSGIPILDFLSPESDFSLAEVTPAPEPATLTLFTFGLLGLAWIHRRRGQSCFMTNSTRRFRPPGAKWISPVYSLEHVAELTSGGGNQSFRWRRPNEPAALEPLRVERHAQPIMLKDLQQVTTFATKNVKITGVRVAA
jgi:hypothetical protein